MLEQHIYTNEKLQELACLRCARTITPPPAKPVLAPLARPIGRAMHRIGHRLESWATPGTETEAPELRLRGRTG